jgi:glycosyltransferase involved in cell wall biosynthesis
MSEAPTSASDALSGDPWDQRYVGDPVDGFPRIAVLIPCFNEVTSITGVIKGFRAHLPRSRIFVYDNNSTDGTAAAAREASAEVHCEPMQGKGHVVRRMFADIEADIYLLVDGDGTYDAASAPEMVRLLIENRLDMVNGVRIGQSGAAWRSGHRVGNAVLSGIVRSIFGRRLSDVLSGYRVFSRRFVKSFPALSAGFETETEFTVHALALNMPVEEVHTSYRERAVGSASKLRTFRDGLRILHNILILVKEERPLQFFSLAGFMLLLLGLGLGLVVLIEFLRTGLVLRLPTAVLAASFMILSFLSFTCGLVLDSVARGRKEIRRLAYLAIPNVAHRIHEDSKGGQLRKAIGPHSCNSRS